MYIMCNAQKCNLNNVIFHVLWARIGFKKKKNALFRLLFTTKYFIIPEAKRSFATDC